jgi:6,7-dimethyl-8-ribityllumazine synthase
MKDGAPTITPDGHDLRVAIVAASWHEAIMNGLLEGARRGLADAGVTDVDVVRVPGTFELSVACTNLADRYDALVALGVVIRGGTPHFDYVCQAATVGITEVSIGTGTPIGFGVLTCDDEAQAIDRAGLHGSSEDKGHEAATAAVATVAALRTALARRVRSRAVAGRPADGHHRARPGPADREELE